MRSLRARLLVMATLVMALFVLACAFTLDRAFELHAAQTQRDRLQALIYALLSATEPTADGRLTLSTFRLPDARLNNPGSGLTAALLDERNGLAWGSVSLQDDFALPPQVAPGEWRFEINPQRFVLVFGIRWMNPIDGEQTYTLAVTEDRGRFTSQMAVYRRTLWGWLAIAAAALISVQGIILAWGLAPLTRLRANLQKVEAGTQAALDHHYPVELRPLTDAINGMIKSGAAQLERQRAALGDLAHSLKTPLAILRGMSEDPRYGSELQQQIDEPVSRMNTIIDHQLRRAVMAGRRTLSEPVAVREVAEKLARSLEKVYRHKESSFVIDIPPSLRLRIDSGDLFEMLGNLLENAAKYGNRRVHVMARRDGTAFLLEVSDDGPGFPDQPERLLERGVRADMLTPGQGIGLAAVAELVEAYRGSIRLLRSTALGGARVEITWQA